MKKFLLVLIILGVLVTYFCYREVSTPIPSNSSKISNSIKLIKGEEFSFDIYVNGGYYLEISPIDNFIHENQILDLSIKKDGYFSSFRKLNKEPNQNSFKYYFGAGNNCTVRIDNLDPSLSNKMAKTKIYENGASASKNLYLMSEFRPYYLSAFKITGITTILLILTFIVVKLKYLKRII